jgi:predicted Zn-dependent protease
MTGPPPTPPSAADLERASALLATDPKGAERIAEALLRRSPNDPRAALILASARRRRGNLKGAQAILSPLARAYPRAALTRYEHGVVLAAVGQTAAALAELQQATALKRDLAEAWKALGELLFQTGDAPGAERAFAEHARAAVRDPRLHPAADAVLDGDLDNAERLLQALLGAEPNHAEALRLLAEVRVKAGDLSGAEVLFAHCLSVDPAFDGARFGYADVLFKQQKGAEALAAVETLLARAPDEAAYRNLAAACLALVGEYHRAISLYEGLLAQYDKQPGLWLNYGQALRTTGRRDEAVAAYKRSMALAPSLGEAYWSLANLKLAAFEPSEIAAMQTQIAAPRLGASDRLHIHYALGKAMEDRADYASAFEHYAAGAAIRREMLAYDADAETATMQRAKAIFTADFFAQREGYGAPSTAPIFIVGLPRSGSTLVEQILASHSQVEGTMELPDIPIVAQAVHQASLQAGGPPYPQALAHVPSGDLAALGETYLRRTLIHRRLGRAYFIDKMPNNFRHLGLIRSILPHAKVIDARRHPMGAGFSAFKQHFAEGQAFSYGLEDLGRYYRDYAALMAHFDAVLPGWVHRVIYEDLVEDTEREVRRLLDYCGLAFEPGCLTFYENDRAVRTVSSEQVRQPIYRGGLDQWRRFEPWLDPLKRALGPALDDWRG